MMWKEINKMTETFIPQSEYTDLMNSVKYQIIHKCRQCFDPEHQECTGKVYYQTNDYYAEGDNWDYEYCSCSLGERAYFEDMITDYNLKYKTGFWLDRYFMMLSSRIDKIWEKDDPIFFEQDI